MATKEVAAGGVLLAGGGAGGGYAAYRYLGGDSSEEEKTTEEQGSEGSQKIEDFLDSGKTSSDKGRPINKLDNGDKEGWWKKAYNKYFLEIDSTSDEIDGVGGKSKRDEGEPGELEKFKTGCQSLLSKQKTGLSDSDTDVQKAKKWCVTYQTVKEQLSEGKNTLDEKSAEKWKNRYGTASGSTDFKFKTLLQKLKGDEETDDKKKEAMYRLCEIAMDAGDSGIKTLVEKNCFDQSQ